MAELTRVCRSADVDEGQLRRVFYGNKRVVLTRVDGAVRAFSNTCPHAGAPLSGGRMVGDCIVCPRHGWHFRVTDGICKATPVYQLRTYLVEERDGGVWIRPVVEEIW